MLLGCGRLGADIGARTLDAKPLAERGVDDASDGDHAHDDPANSVVRHCSFLFTPYAYVRNIGTGERFLEPMDRCRGLAWGPEDDARSGA